VSAVVTVTAIGISCNVVARFEAVTTISSSILSCAKVIPGAATVAIAIADTIFLNEKFIQLLLYININGLYIFIIKTYTTKLRSE
jgi:hypothetical protein